MLGDSPESFELMEDAVLFCVLFSLATPAALQKYSGLYQAVKNSSKFAPVATMYTVIDYFPYLRWE